MQNQTYSQIEHIVIDGGSEDGTVDVLRSEASIVWVSEKDRGQSDAINKGFAMAKGDIVGWLNSDDTLTEDSVQSSVDAFTSDPSIGWTYGKCLIVEGDSSFVLSPPPELRPESLDRGNVIPQPGSLYSREALEAVGPLDESLHLAMDFDLFLRLLLRGHKAQFLDKVLAVFEIHEDSKNGRIGPVEFMKDELKAFARSGRTQAAIAHLARVCVAVADDGSRIRGQVLEREVRQLLNENDLSAPLSYALGMARTEAAMVETQRSIWGLRHLLRPSVWRVKSSRRRIKNAFLRGARDPMIRPSVRFGHTSGD